MRTAPIVPIRYLDVLEGQPYLMCLAQIALENEKYKEFYREQSKQGSFILLDNGAFEGDQVSIDKLVQLAEYIQADELILIDTPKDYKKNLRTHQESYDAVQSLYGFAGQTKIQLMAVPHGETEKELLESAEKLVKMNIDTLGVSKIWLEQFGPIARSRFVSNITEIIGNLNLHILGSGQSPWEAHYIAAEHPEIVRGTDSCIPYLFAANGEVMKHHSTRPDVEIDFFNPVRCDNDLLRTNIEEWNNGYGKMEL